MAQVPPTFSDLSNTTITVYNTTDSAGGFQVATLTALRAIASASTNISATVRDDGTGSLRVYQWSTASTAADDGLATIAPNDGGVGRWILVF